MSAEGFSRAIRKVHCLRLSQSEADEIASRAKQAGTNVSDFVRRSALGRSFKATMSVESWHAYMRLGEADRSLRRLTRQCQAARDRGEASEVQPEDLQAVRDQLKAVAAQLRGDEQQPESGSASRST